MTPTESVTLPTPAPAPAQTPAPAAPAPVAQTAPPAVAGASSEIQDFFKTFTSEAPEEPNPMTTADPGTQPAEQPQQPAAIDYDAMAGQHGLDASNPLHRKLIEQLSATTAAAAATVPESTPPVFDFDAIEQALLADIQPKAPAPVPAVPAAAAAPPAPPPPVIDPAAQPVPPQGTPSFNDGFTWENEQQAYDTLGAAWDNGDKDTYQRASQALFNRNLMGALPYVLEPFRAQLQESQSLVKRLQAELEEVRAPYVEARTIERRQNNANIAFRSIAYGEGEKPRQGFEDFHKLTQAPENGATVDVLGQKMSATPLNSILSANPWIFDIKVHDENPDVAERKTYAKQYIAAYTIFKTGQQRAVTPKEAAAAFEAGRATTQQRQNETARHAINAPGQPQPTGGGSGSYVSQVNAVTGNAADFFPKR